MDEKPSFAVGYPRGKWPTAALCEEYGISRKTGCKRVARCRRRGPEDPVGRPRRGSRAGRAGTSPAVGAPPGSRRPCTSRGPSLTDASPRFRFLPP